MGTTAKFLFIKAINPIPPNALELEDGFSDLGSAAPGWYAFEGPGESAWKEFVDLSRKIGAHHEAVLGVALEDSDFALVTSVVLTDVALAVINSELAEGHVEGSWALAQCERLFGRSDWQADAASSFAEWSVAAPLSAQARDIELILRRRWTAVDEAFDSLLRLLGLALPEPSLAGFAEASGVRNSGRANGKINRAKARFVYGWGDDFTGIWDRANPGPPIRRFPKTLEGARQANKEWLRLVEEQDF